MSERRSPWLLGLWVFTVALGMVGLLKHLELQRKYEVLKAEQEQTAAILQKARTQDEIVRQEAALPRDERLELLRLRGEVTQLRATAAAAREAARSAVDSRYGLSRVEVAEAPAANDPGEAVQHATESKQAESYDPMAFYRKNPELMKRYFPHLYREQVEQTAAEATPQRIAPDQKNPQTVGDTNGYDPLSYYRKNPQLMRRYFPHLVPAAEQDAAQQPPEQVTKHGSLPPEPSPNP